MKFFCRRCETEKPREEFFRDASKGSGHRPRCKACDTASIDRTARQVYMKDYRAANAEVFQRASLAAYHQNKDRYRAVQEVYRQTDAYRKLHRKHSADARARRAGVFQESIDIFGFFEASDKRCAYCGRHLISSNFQIDHIVPISKGGLHQLSNLAVSCRLCNIRKSNKPAAEVSNQIL